MICPTHKQTEGRAPVWSSEFTTKAAVLQGDSAYCAASQKRDLWDLVAGDCLPSETAECNLEEPFGKSCASAAKKQLFRQRNFASSSDSELPTLGRLPDGHQFFS